MARPGAFSIITMQLIDNYLSAAVDEMMQAVVRTSLSPITREVFDFQFDYCRADGEILLEGEATYIHSLIYQSLIENRLRENPGDTRPGDVMITNDPYSDASHLPNVYIFRPIFAGDDLVAWAIRRRPPARRRRNDARQLPDQRDGNPPGRSAPAAAEAVRARHSQQDPVHDPERRLAHAGHRARRHRRLCRGLRRRRATVSRTGRRAWPRPAGRLSRGPARLYRAAGPGRDRGDAGRRLPFRGPARRRCQSGERRRHHSRGQRDDL